MLAISQKALVVFTWCGTQQLEVLLLDRARLQVVLDSIFDLFQLDNVLKLRVFCHPSILLVFHLLLVVLWLLDRHFDVSVSRASDCHRKRASLGR